MPERFILYACPIGELATQLDRYFAASLQICGRNAAHHYMPHCSLTGFFQDEVSAVALYQSAITQALTAQSTADSNPVIQVIHLSFRSDWHGLEIASDWLHQLMARVCQFATSPTRSTALRLKSWLHLSLAYEFSPDQAQTLIDLAQTCIDPQSPVGWELRFYQRHPDDRWTCHQAWPLILHPNLLKS